MDQENEKATPQAEQGLIETIQRVGQLVEDVMRDATAQSAEVAHETARRYTEIALFQSRQQLCVIIITGALMLTTIGYIFVTWESAKATREATEVQREILQVQKEILAIEQQRVEKAAAQEEKRSARKRK